LLLLLFRVPSPLQPSQSSPQVQETREKRGTFVSQSDLLATGTGSLVGQTSEVDEELHSNGPDAVPPLVVKRLNKATEEQLREELLDVKELDLRAVKYTDLLLLDQASDFAKCHAQEVKNGKTPPDFLGKMIQGRSDLAGLPFLRGKTCRLDKNRAATLQAHATAIRRKLSGSALVAPSVEDKDLQVDRSLVHFYLRNGKKHFCWQESEGLPALQQILMGEGKKARLFLVECLFQIKDRKGTEALARRAIFELDPGIREAALMGLQLRPKEHYRHVLVNGLDYAWVPIARHAAEALVALKMREAVPDLIGLLEKPNPTAPFPKHTQNNKTDLYIRELVRVNHFGNCLLCHAPSVSESDPVRGLIPAPDQRFPPPLSHEYYPDHIRSINRGIGFVRADVTYVRQDFSTALPVANPGNWPKWQRFDYLVRERRLTREELARLKQRQPDIKAQTLSEHRKAILFALRELTGRDMGSLPGEWKKLLSAGSHTPK
jgi:hypothetical protein